MTPEPTRLAYDDFASPDQLRADARAVARVLRPAPSLRFEDYPREVVKREIRIDEAAARLAAALYDA